MQKTNLLALNKAQGISFLYELLEVSSVKNVQSVKQIIHNITKHGSSNLLKGIEHNWYMSLEAGQPDYSVYEPTEYLAEVWFCWETYSKTYLRDLQTPKLFPPYGIQKDNQDSKLIIDLGNGLGFTTASLKMMFPNAEVIGTNIKDSEQDKIANILGALYGFTTVADIREVKTQPDLLVAFEYFEHFEQPLQHLQETIGITKPKRLLLANTFNGDAIGHFHYYKIDNKIEHGKKLPRLFNKALRDIGYEKIETKLWNNRPSYWKLKTNADQQTVS